MPLDLNNPLLKFNIISLLINCSINGYFLLPLNSQVALRSLHIGSAATSAVPVSARLTCCTSDVTLTTWTTHAHTHTKEHEQIYDGSISARIFKWISNFTASTHPGSRSSSAPAGCSSHLYRWSRFRCRRWAYSDTERFPAILIKISIDHLPANIDLSQLSYAGRDISMNI